jgi:hypothetical protein
VIIDLSAAARRPDPERLREWLADQRLFISSAMGDTSPERQSVAAIVEQEGARAVRFEEFGRDADAEEAYLTEVDSSTIYVGILNEIYGRPNQPDGFSATEMEYRRAREGGKRLLVLVAADPPARDGQLKRFIDHVQFYVTTENYTDAADVAGRVRRRLHELAGEALSPWVKLGELVFRADEVIDREQTITIRARASDEVGHQLETIRGDRYTRRRVRFVHDGRVRDGEIVSLQRTTRAGGSDELMIELGNVSTPGVDPYRAGAQGIEADDLVELGLRAIFFGEPLPAQLGPLESMADSGIDANDLQQAFDLPNEFAESVTRLVVADGLVGRGKAGRIISCSVGPRNANVRHVAIEWGEATPYSNVTPGRRRIEGEWRP